MKPNFKRFRPLKRLKNQILGREFIGNWILRGDRVRVVFLGERKARTFIVTGICYNNSNTLILVL